MASPRNMTCLGLPTPRTWNLREGFSSSHSEHGTMQATIDITFQAGVRKRSSRGSVNVESEGNQSEDLSLIIYPVF